MNHTLTMFSTLCMDARSGSLKKKSRDLIPGFRYLGLICKLQLMILVCFFNRFYCSLAISVFLLYHTECFLSVLFSVPAIYSHHWNLSF